MQRLNTSGWTRKELETWDDMQTYEPRVQVQFQKMVEAGESVAMAAMLAVRKPPTSGIDDRLVMANSCSVTEQFKGSPEMLALYRRNYKASTGDNLPEDAVVYRSLVQSPGDPRFIVTHKNSLDQVRANARALNLQVEGEWENHPVSQAPQPQTIRMNNSVLGSWRKYYLEESDEREVMAKLSNPELNEMIIETHAPVVTPDEAMNAARTIDECSKRTFGKMMV